MAPKQLLAAFLEHWIQERKERRWSGHNFAAAKSPCTEPFRSHFSAGSVQKSSPRKGEGKLRATDFS